MASAVAPAMASAAAGSPNRGAAPITPAAVMIIAAIGDPVVGMASGELAALRLTQGGTGSITPAILMAVAAVDRLIVNMASGNIAVLNRTQFTAICLRGIPVVAAVGISSRCQKKHST